MKELIIDKTNEGGRLDKLVLAYLDKAPKGFVYKMLRKKNIVLNNGKAAGNEILKAGDVITLYLSDETTDKFRSSGKTVHMAGADHSFEDMIVFEDENIIIMNKPCGLLSQRSGADDVSLNELMLAHLSEAAENGFGFKPGISNRLDRNTTGTVMAGKNLAASRELNSIISSHRIKKCYRCIAVGRIDEGKDIKAFISKDSLRNISAVSETCSEGAQPIETVIRPICSKEHLSYLEVELVTGRSHQIRAQLAALGHPIIGDDKYGDRALNTEYREKYGDMSQLLHAYSISFSTEEGILGYLNGRQFISPLPELFVNILKGEDLWQPGTAEA